MSSFDSDSEMLCQQSLVLHNVLSLYPLLPAKSEIFYQIQEKINIPNRLLIELGDLFPERSIYSFGGNT